MYKKYISILVVISITLVSILILNPYHIHLKAQAQSESLSLITPYFGTKEITSYFDHGTPNYAQDHSFINYIGRKFDVDKANCYEGGSELTNSCYDGHNGLDIGMSYEHVLAAADGIVWFAGWAASLHYQSYGLEVLIKHTVNGQVYSTRYGHLTTITVINGENVKAGQIIGTSGSTGDSTGPHLHFDVSICINTDCSDDQFDFRAIDPFGWQPAPGERVQIDPWDTTNGAHSWCMWGDGEFVNKCDPGRSSHPLPEPVYGNEIIVDDTINNTLGFSKGYNGRWNNICTGIDPGCREWWESSGTGIGWGNHTYRTITNGLAGNYNTPDNWAEWRPQSLTPGNYEVFVWVPENLGFNNNTFTWQAHFQFLNSDYNFKSISVDEYIDGYGGYNPRNKWLSSQSR